MNVVDLPYTFPDVWTTAKLFNGPVGDALRDHLQARGLVAASFYPYGVFAVNLAIGMFTPPFGLNLFIIQSIFKKPLDQIARSVPPFFVVFLLALIIITYFPQLYMWIPKLWLAQ
jgi:hypothetical protein